MLTVSWGVQPAVACHVPQFFEIKGMLEACPTIEAALFQEQMAFNNYDRIGNSNPPPCWSSRVTIEPISVVLVQS